MSHFNTSDDVRRALGAQGVNVNRASVQKMLAAARERARTEAQKQAHPATNPAAASVIEKTLNWGVIIVMGFITVLFVLVLFGLFAVETAAVVDGLALLMDRWKAMLLGVVLVGAFYVVMFVAEMLQTNSNTDGTVYKRSLRNTTRAVSYWLGRGDDWQPERVENPTYTAALGIQRGLIWTIIFISVVGRNAPLLERVSDTSAAEGIVLLFQTASLLDWFASIGILLATFNALAASHFFFQFLYTNFVRITGGLNMGKGAASQDYDTLYQALSEQYEMEVLENLLYRERAKANN